MKERRLLMLLSASGLPPGDPSQTATRYIVPFAKIVFAQKRGCAQKATHERHRIAADESRQAGSLSKYSPTCRPLSGHRIPSTLGCLHPQKHAQKPVNNMSRRTSIYSNAKPSERDKHYARLIGFVEKRIRHFDRFKSNRCTGLHLQCNRDRAIHHRISAWNRAQAPGTADAGGERRLRSFRCRR